jgi:hypothetical protein
MNAAAKRMAIKAKVAAALGLLTETSTRYDLSLIFTKVIHDPIVDVMAHSYGFEQDPETGLDTCVMAVTYCDYLEIVEKMSAHDKQELRQRIAAQSTTNAAAS